MTAIQLAMRYHGLNRSGGWRPDQYQLHDRGKYKEQKERPVKALKQPQDILTEDTLN